jgi:hypothetical protein
MPSLRPERRRRDFNRGDITQLIKDKIPVSGSSLRDIVFMDFAHKKTPPKRGF